MLFPEQGDDSGFDAVVVDFDASSEVHLHSSLYSTHDVVKATPFNRNVHHRGFLTEAASGSLKPPPTRRLRRIYLHLSYSIAPPDAFLTQSLLSNRTCRFPASGSPESSRLKHAQVVARCPSPPEARPQDSGCAATGRYPAVVEKAAGYA